MFSHHILEKLLTTFIYLNIDNYLFLPPKELKKAKKHLLLDMLLIY